MGTRSVAVTVAFMLVGVMAVGVASAAEEDWETVAVGAVWSRRVEIWDPQQEVPYLQLESETKRDPAAIRYTVTSKNDKVDSVFFQRIGYCEEPVFDGKRWLAVHRETVTPPFVYVDDVASYGESGQCLLHVFIAPEPDDMLGKMRLKVEANY